MANAILEATIHSDGATARIELRGDIDGSAREALNGAYADASGANAVTLDFTNVDYINSTGIALIVRLLADARRAHRSVRARGLSAHYEEIFRITRLSDFMTLEHASIPTPSS